MTVVADRDAKYTPSALHYEILVTPDAHSASGYAEGIVSTLFTVSVTEGRIDGNFSPGLRADMVTTSYGFSSRASGFQSTGFTIDGGSFGDFEYGLNGRDNIITIGSPSIQDTCPYHDPNYHGPEAYYAAYVPLNPVNNPCSCFGVGCTCNCGGTLISNSAACWVPVNGWVWQSYSLNPNTPSYGSTSTNYNTALGSRGTTLNAAPRYYPAWYECETDPENVQFSPSNPLGYTTYEDDWNVLTLEIILDGLEVFNAKIGDKVNDNVIYEVNSATQPGIPDGIRVSYQNGQFIPKDAITSGANRGLGIPSGSPGPSQQQLPNTGFSPGDQFVIPTDNGNPSYGDHGDYPEALIVTVYFDEAFGQIPPGSSLQIITDPTGQHILAYQWNTPYGNSGLISGDPYLDKYDEPNARIRFRDSSIVEGGISTFMKTFDYQSGVGGCKDC
jgi:hypothetical protein